jgi:hypothetical protein
VCWRARILGVVTGGATACVWFVCPLATEMHARMRELTQQLLQVALGGSLGDPPGGRGGSGE